MILGNKDEILKEYERNPSDRYYIIESLPEEMKDNETVMFDVIKKNVICLKFASNRLKNDKAFILKIINNYDDTYNNQHYFSVLSDDLKNDKEIVLTALNKNPLIFQFASDRLKDDDEVASLAISLHGNNIKYLSNRLKADKSIILQAQTVGYFDWDCMWNCLSESQKKDKEIVLFLLTKSRFLNVDDILDMCIQDRDILLTAVKYHPDILQKLPNNLKTKEVILSAVSKETKYAIKYIPEEYIYDRDVVLTTIKNEKHSEILRNRIQLPKEYYVENLPENLKEDKEIIISLINKSEGDFVLSLDDLPEKIKIDRDVILAYLKFAPSQIDKYSDKLTIDDLNQLKAEILEQNKQLDSKRKR